MSRIECGLIRHYFIDQKPDVDTLRHSNIH
jgi:hypothetical protein